MYVVRKIINAPHPSRARAPGKQVVVCGSSGERARAGCTSLLSSSLSGYSGESRKGELTWTHNSHSSGSPNNQIFLANIQI